MIIEDHHIDSDGNPAGGTTKAKGINIVWQRGPLGRGKDRQKPNGAFVEDVIEAAIGRLQFYQGTKFACGENMRAIQDLSNALSWLHLRTAAREARKVEGTHKI